MVANCQPAKHHQALPRCLLDSSSFASNSNSNNNSNNSSSEKNNPNNSWLDFMSFGPTRNGCNNTKATLATGRIHRQRPSCWHPLANYIENFQPAPFTAISLSPTVSLSALPAPFRVVYFWVILHFNWRSLCFMCVCVCAGYRIQQNSRFRLHSLSFTLPYSLSLYLSLCARLQCHLHILPGICL